MPASGKMMAVVYDRYGGPDVLRLAEVPKPDPAGDEILVRIHATTVTSGDCRLRSMDMPLGFSALGRAMYGVRRPKKMILGSEFSGTVEKSGADVTAFQVGDQVFGLLDAKMGCHAEYCCVPESGAVARKPSHLSHRQAAALSFGGTTALDFLRRGRLRSGERILVNGSSGCVGSAVVQIARSFGAEVTGVCGPRNTGVVKALGANRVIDYSEQDFVSGGESYDVIVDTVGNCSYRRCNRVLNEGGRLMLVAADLMDMLNAPLITILSAKRVLVGPTAVLPDDIRAIADLVENNSLRPLLDRVYPIEEIKDAHRHVDTGRKRGNVVIELIHDDRSVTSIE